MGAWSLWRLYRWSTVSYLPFHCWTFELHYYTITYPGEQGATQRHPILHKNQIATIRCLAKCIICTFQLLCLALLGLRISDFICCLINSCVLKLLRLEIAVLLNCCACRWRQRLLLSWRCWWWTFCSSRSACTCLTSSNVHLIVCPWRDACQAAIAFHCII